jgi:hypothetical protein
MSSDKILSLLDKMWLDYTQLNPKAQKIVELFESKGEKITNDHIALRTFNLPRVCVDEIAKPFLACGYVEKNDYHFEEKKLYAKHYEHSDPSLPKVFISELLVEKFSTSFQQKVRDLVENLTDAQIQDFYFTCSGRPWKLTSSEYEELKKESDYGAWLAAIGYRPNHFTVFINELKEFSEITVLNKFLKDNGFKLNDSGGEIKGSKDVLLEQSSTLADSVEVEFIDKKMVIPSCYYEFAKRYPMANGKLYQGFVATSADKIFESTNKGQ